MRNPRKISTSISEAKPKGPGLTKKSKQPNSRSLVLPALDQNYPDIQNYQDTVEFDPAELDHLDLDSSPVGVVGLIRSDVLDEKFDKLKQLEEDENSDRGALRSDLDIGLYDEKAIEGLRRDDSSLTSLPLANIENQPAETVTHILIHDVIGEIKISVPVDKSGYLPLIIDQISEIEEKTEKVLGSEKLRAEVQDMLNGKNVPPKYDRKEHINPLNYLKKFYGKFLAAFRDDSQNFIYLFQLRKIDPYFVNTANKWLVRNEKTNISSFVPTKKQALTDAIEEMEAKLDTISSGPKSLKNLVEAQRRRKPQKMG